MQCNKCKFEVNCNLKEIAPDITGCTGHSKPKEDKIVKTRSKKLKSIWMCCNCRARTKMITGEKFKKPDVCECGSKEFV